MGRFLTDLVVKRLPDRDGRKQWELQEWLIYESSTVGLICVPPKRVTDFSSVPRFPILYLLFGGRGDREGALHDFLYDEPHTTGTGQVVDRSLSDKVLRGARYGCERVDLSEYESVTVGNLLKNAWVYVGAWCFWVAVRVVGWRYWKK